MKTFLKPILRLLALLMVAGSFVLAYRLDKIVDPTTILALDGAVGSGLLMLLGVVLWALVQEPQSAPRS